jgi:hypothetical protein
LFSIRAPWRRVYNADSIDKTKGKGRSKKSQAESDVDHLGLLRNLDNCVKGSLLMTQLGEIPEKIIQQNLRFSDS